MPVPPLNASGQLEPRGGGLDDSANIQAWLDTLKPIHDTPLFGTAEGGVVRLSRGLFTIATTINLWTGCYVVGEGEFGTVLYGSIANAAIVKITPITDFMVCNGLDMVRVENASTTVNGSVIGGWAIGCPIGQLQTSLWRVKVGNKGNQPAIKLDGSVCQVVNFQRISNTDQSLGGPLISCFVQHGIFNDIAVQGSANSNWTTGSPCLSIDCAGGFGISINNYLAGFSFPEGKTGYALRTDGPLDINSSHFELAGDVTDDTAARFEGGGIVNIGTLGVIGAYKLYFENDAVIRKLDCTGAVAPLSYYIEKSATSRIRIQHAIVTQDAGSLDDPNLWVDHITSTQGDYSFANPPRVQQSQLCLPSIDWTIDEGAIYSGLVRGPYSIAFNVTTISTVIVRIPAMSEIGDWIDLKVMPEGASYEVWNAAFTAQIPAVRSTGSLTRVPLRDANNDRTLGICIRFTNAPIASYAISDVLISETK